VANQDTQNNPLSPDDLPLDPTGLTPTAIPTIGQIPELVSASLLVVNPITLAATTSTQTFAHNLGREPTIILPAIRTGTDGAGAAGTQVPGSFISWSADANNIEVILTDGNDGGCSFDVLLG
jgi:hypothetical protein